MTRNDYPLREVPEGDRRGFWSLVVILVGFTFFTATMWAGGSLGVAFDFTTLLLVIVVGNLLLGVYAAALGYMAARSGLNTVLMARYCFGEKGSRLADCILGFTQVGWYAWGTATMAILLVRITGLPEMLTLPLMVLFGIGFCLTAMVGYRGLELLSRFAVPAMLLLIALSLSMGVIEVGGLGGLMAMSPTESLSIGAAITMIIGTFVSGGTQATNWTRFASSGRDAVVATLLAFFIGNGLMVLTGALGALVYQQADIVDVMLAQGLAVLAVAMLFLNIWTTQDNTIYNFAVAGCNLLRTERRALVTLVGAGIGTALAIFGMYDMLVPFLILLGTFIPPLGGVLMADFYIRRRGAYAPLAQANLPDYLWTGLAAYGIGAAVAYFSPFIAPVVGVLVAGAAYLVLERLAGQAIAPAGSRN
ncbi:MAG: cytosine permease [Ectothiorhodospiraceae bacterium]|nr:cytosine permease [Ectothiorhodospiraceae bacterium]